MTLTVNNFYEEANTSRRYYLSLAVNTRNIAIAQGVATLVSFGILLRFNLWMFLPVTAGFGFLFTIVLTGLHWNYLKYFEDCQTYLIELETKFGFSENGCKGLCSVIEPSRNERVGRGWKRYFILYGAFILLGSTTFCLFIFSLYSIFNLPAGA